MCLLDLIEQLFPAVGSLKKEKTLFLLSDVCSGVKYFLKLNDFFLALAALKTYHPIS